MQTVTGILESSTGELLHAKIVFESLSTPQTGASGLVTGNTKKIVRSDPTTGVYSVGLRPGFYQVTFQTKPKETTFKIQVTGTGGSVSIEQLVIDPLPTLPGQAPYLVWNGVRAGHITFDPIDDAPAPTVAEVAYTGGHASASDTYIYKVSYITAEGETALSFNSASISGSGAANKAIRVSLEVSPARVLTKRIWRAKDNTGILYYLLAEVGPTVASYDDWESHADFATRAAYPPNIPLFNTTAGIVYSKAGQQSFYFSSTGLNVVNALTLSGSMVLDHADGLFHIDSTPRYGGTGTGVIWKGGVSIDQAGGGLTIQGGIGATTGGKVQLIGGAGGSGAGGDVYFRPGIGTTAGKIVLDGTIQIPAGAVNGYVLTSDATGKATWQVSAGGGGGVPSTRAINTTSPLTGGGDLSADRTLALAGLSGLGTANQLLGMNNGATAYEYKNLNGTTNQVTVTHGLNSVTLALPQNIHTSGTPQFSRIGFGGAADATHLVKVTGGTVTADTHLWDGSQTWNSSGVTFTGILLNIVNTASAGASKLFDFQVSGISKASLSTAGTLTATAFVGAGSSLTSLNASNLSSGTVPAAQMPALTGDVTTSAGTVATTIAAGVVTYAKMQNISATARVLGRKTAGAGSTEELTFSDVLDLVGSAVQGDIIYRGATTWTRLGAGTSGQFLKTQGAAANPLWATIPGGGDMLAANNLSDVANVTTARTNLGLGTASTPQFARLGLGGAADAVHILELTGGTVTVDTHLVDATQTWNASGVTFTGVKVNITNTASAAGSLLMDLQIGTVSQFKVDKAGNLTAVGGVTAASFAGSGASLTALDAGNISAGTLNLARLGTTGTPQFARLGLGGAAGATHLLTITGGTVTVDTHLLELSQTWNAGGVVFTAIKLNITDTASASGSFLIDLRVGGSSLFNVNKSGLLTSSSASFGGVSSNSLDINGGTHVLASAGTGTLGNSSLTLDGTTVQINNRLGIGGTADATHIEKVTGGTVTADTHLWDGSQTWNASGTTFTALKLSITNTASAAASLLLDLQVGGTSQFKVDKAGSVTLLGTLTAATLNATGLTASQAVVTDASKNLASVAYTGTGNVMRTRVGVYRTLWIGAGAMVPGTTSGAATGSYAPAGADGEAIDVFDFDDTTSENTQFMVNMPDEWDRGTVKVKFYWTTVSGTGGVTWGIAMGAASDNDALGAILGTEVTVDDTRLADATVHGTAATGAVTVGGAPALGDVILGKIQRKTAAANDTKVGDARLLGIAIQYLELTTEASVW